jgi:hypothetical protein
MNLDLQKVRIPDLVHQFTIFAEDSPKDIEVVLYAWNIAAMCIFQLMQKVERVTPHFDALLKSLNKRCGSVCYCFDWSLKF